MECICLLINIYAIFFETEPSTIILTDIFKTTTVYWIHDH